MFSKIFLASFEQISGYLKNSWRYLNEIGKKPAVLTMKIHLGLF